MDFTTMTTLQLRWERAVRNDGPNRVDAELGLKLIAELQDVKERLTTARLEIARLNNRLAAIGVK